MAQWIQKLNDYLNLFLLSRCSLCQRSTDKEFCLDCERQLQRCQLSDANQSWKGELPVLAWGMYGGVLKRALAALKYDNQPQLARPLGHWLGEVWLKSPVSLVKSGNRKQMPLVVPIPMHTAKQKLRGYNQAELLAQSFCDITGLPLQQLGLERIRETEAQFGLSGTAREQNLTEAFVVGKAFRQRPPSVPILLLDDIYTTGATVRSAAQALHKQGISVYGLVAVAQAGRQT